MNKPAFFALALICTAFTGCTGVYVPQPIGTKPVTLAAGDWEGTWFDGSGACEARIVDAAAGQLELLSIKTHDGQSKLEVTTLLVREAEGWVFLNLRDDDPAKNRYEWARAKLDGEQLVVWLPKKEAFIALVQSGKLRGRLEDKDVVLEPLSAADLKALTSGALGVPFDWEKPFVFRRLAH